MKNVPLPPLAYQEGRDFLRKQEITYRDMRQVSAVPSWREALCLSDIMIGDMTPGQLAYRTLAKEFPKVRLSWRQEEMRFLEMSPPKLFTPFERIECYGLDIARAYCQFYSRLGLDADWPNKRVRYPLNRVAEILLPEKAARNAVVGLAISTKNKWVKGEKVWYSDKYNRYLSPVLWGQLQTILHQIAIRAGDLGAIHINTDGYVFPNQTARDELAAWLSTFGVEYRTYQGIGTALGLNSLKVDGHKDSKRNDVSKKAFVHIEQPGYDMLSWWATRC